MTDVTGHRSDIDCADIMRTQSDPQRLNEEIVKSLPLPDRGNKIHYFPGAVLQGIAAPRGFGVRVTASGAKAFVLNYRIKQREYRYTIGAYPDWSALKAVRQARELRQRIDKGENPLHDRAPPAAPQRAKTVADVIEDFIKRYVEAPARPLRSAKEYRYALRSLVIPALGTISIRELRRSHIADMLDQIAEGHGPVQADRTLAYFRKCLNWYAARDDEFIPPIAPGMARTRGSERARIRTLSDDEIRALWTRLDGTFGAIIKVLLLTAQRRTEVGQMRRTEIDKDNVWTIPAERYKGKRPHAVPLTTATLAVIDAQPKGDIVFPQRKGTPFTMYGTAKTLLDEALAKSGSPLPHWTLHDLRRTAKTLMVRAGVRPDISERVLGHVIAGVEGTYDRYSYLDEKRAALEALAAMVERILEPPAANVVPLAEARA